MDCFAEPVIRRRFAPTGWLAMTVKYRSSTTTVMPREGGASSRLQPIDSIIDVSGILDHPPQCAIAHKAGDDD